MPRQNGSTADHNDGWLITPRALTSVATVVGLVYTLHAPVRYVLRVGASVDALTARVAMLETEIEHQRGTVPAPPTTRAEELSDPAVSAGRRSVPMAGEGPPLRATVMP